MSKLDKLSNEELGRLFPIEIMHYDNNWPKLFRLEKNKIKKVLGNFIALRIEHFGSTAIKGLSAKPVIDILVEIPKLTDELKSNIIERMEPIGYNFIWRTDDAIPYMNFVKGYAENGYSGQLYHVHMGDKYHPLWNRLLFKEYLIKHENVAKEYVTLKKQLARKFKYNREKYTQGKSEFVKRITALAISENDDLGIYSNKLSGGDLRSIGKANEVVSIIKTQKDFDMLFSALFHSDRKVVMRTADAIEKITLTNPEYLNNHKKKIIGLCKISENIELKWHLALLVSRIELSDKESGIIWQILTHWATDKKESKIVRVNSIQGLFNLISQKPELIEDFNLTISEIENEKIPSINARIRKIRNAGHQASRGPT
jgi:GrpB-like predicted nucleotidyltransferase (UPF0157 family)